jgi:hypothetical protein
MKKNVKIHLTEPSRSNAAEALFPNPEPRDYEYQHEYGDRVNAAARLRNEFTGPLFEGATECEIDEGVVHVLIDDVGYVYPLHAVARLKVWEAPPEPPKVNDPDDDIPF